MPKVITGTKKTFWSKLPKPFYAIAPMANVTDSVFRKLLVKYGKPDVMWTEFVSADGLNSAGQSKLLVDLVYTERERPIVAQVFTGHPEEMRKAAAMIMKLGFDGLDINMGCPDRSVQKQGGGAALMRDHRSALEIIKAAREGVALTPARSKIGNSIYIPVSVKTRIGFNSVDLSWIEFLLRQDLPALTIHLRTKKEMSDVPAHWDLMPAIIKMREEICPSTIIIGNGDVGHLEQAERYAKEYGCDGVMIGRGIFGKPWLLHRAAGRKKAESMEKTPKDRIKILVEHARLFDRTYCGKRHIKSFDVMRKHFKAYVSGWDGAKELRTLLMGTNNSKEVEKVVATYLN